MVDIKTMNNSIQKNVLADIVTVKTSLNTNNIFKFDENWCFIVVLSVTPNWDSIPKKNETAGFLWNILRPSKLLNMLFTWFKASFENFLVHHHIF